MRQVLFFLFFILVSNLLYSQCTTENAISCECEDSDEVSCDLLPDITVSWQWGIGDYEEYPPGSGLQDGEINYPDNWFEITPEVEAMGRIRVGARTPNIGSGPLNLRGADKDGYRWMICYDSGVADTFSVYDPNWNEESYCPDGSAPKHISIQRIYQKKADGSMDFYEVMVGTMEYHPTHGHMHFNEWTIMSLRIPDPNNMENPLEWEIVGDGAKVGFCVMDLGNCSSEAAGCRDDETVYNEGNLLSQNDFPNYGLGGGGYGCSPVSQGISVGYNDTYGSYLDGMFLNIPLGTCNGDYAVVLEVPQVMVEERLDNNFTWFPVTLTQQTGVPNVPEITSSASSLVCEGQNISLSIDAPNNTTLLWSDGSTSESIEINQAGTYSVTISSEDFSCPTTKDIVVNTISNPSVEPVIVCANESAYISVESEYDVTWYDENMTIVGAGNNFTTPVLNESVNYFVSNSFSDNNVGPEEHQGDSEYSGGDNAIGFLSFDALSNFILESVNVYTNEPGERKFILINESGDVIAEHTEFIGFSDEEPQTVLLNFEVATGNNYQIGTDASVNEISVGGQNPQLKRTGTGGDLSYPYVLDGKVSINKAVYYGQGLDGSGGDDYTSYYYYLYDWVVAGDPIECDLVAIPVTIEGVTTTESAESCDQFEWNGNIYSESGIYTYESIGEFGCSNSEILILTINNSSSSFEEITSCDAYDWNGNIYTQSGVYTFESLNEQECANIETLNLTINNSSSSFEEMTSCDEFEWNGNIYTESGTYTFESLNQQECINIETLDLTIYNSTSFTQNMTTCDSYEWNGTNYTESGTYTYESLNNQGCSNVETLFLTISNESDTEYFEAEACDDYNWNNVSYTESGEYVYQYIGENGCVYNSILSLTINNSTFTYEDITACESYEWNSEIYIESGTYTIETLNEFGCIHSSTIDLTISDSSITTNNITTCDESYLWNDVTYTESGTYYNELSNVDGCDSTSILNLIIAESISENEIIGNPNPLIFETHTYSLVDNGNSYDWSVEGGVIISNNINSVEIQWGIVGQGVITLIESNEGCTLENYFIVTIGNNIEESWNCLNGFCVDPLDGSGVYNSLDNCQFSCQNSASISEINNLNVLIFPNPSSNIFFIELFSESNFELFVFNALGEKVYYESAISNGKYKTQIDLSNFSKGIFNLLLKNSNGVISQKLILQ